MELELGKWYTTTNLDNYDIYLIRKQLDKDGGFVYTFAIGDIDNIFDCWFKNDEHFIKYYELDFNGDM